MILSIYVEKAFDKIQHPFLIKTLQKVGIVGPYLNIIKAIHENPQKTSFSMVKSWKNPHWDQEQDKDVCSHHYSTAIREVKEIKGIQIGKEEVKLSLFADDMILHLENHKDSNKKLLELILEFGKVTGYKINTQKWLHFYILTMKDQKEKLGKE